MRKTLREEKKIEESKEDEISPIYPVYEVMIGTIPKKPKIIELQTMEIDLSFSSENSEEHSQDLQPSPSPKKKLLPLGLSK